MASTSMKNHDLLWYLEKYLSLNGSMELAEEPLDTEHHLPWNRETCLFVLTYVVQFCSNVNDSEFSRAIMDLDDISKSVHASYIKQHDDDADDCGYDYAAAVSDDDDDDHYYDDDDDDDDDDEYDDDEDFDDDNNNGGNDDNHNVGDDSSGGVGGDLDEEISKKTQNQQNYLDEINKKQQEFSRLLVNSFVPDVVSRFFKVPKLHQLPDKDRHLKPHDVLAGFIDFLLQVLYHEANTSVDEKQRYILSLLRKQLSFLLAVLGDTPFQFSNHELAEDVGNLLVEFEILANEAGILVYDFVFHIHHLVETNRFDARANVLSGKFELLSAKIKEHCLWFAELPSSEISRSSVVDSFFIINSLIVDIENLMNRRLNITDDDSIKDQIVTLHGELTILQNFIKVSQVPNEQKVGVIKIGDLAYEIEYLISSYVVGNMCVWYLNLRLMYLIQKIKLANMEQQNSEMHAGKAMKATEDPVTMDDNYSVDVNSDITLRNNYRKKLELSYKKLPYYLKPCCLFVAAFPKDVETSKKHLAWMWIVEGNIQKEERKLAEDCSSSETSNLRSLSFVCIHREKEVEILRDLQHLHKLKFMCGGDVIFPDIGFLTKLESLKICFEISSRDIEVSNFNFPYRSRMKKLCLSGAVLTRENMRLIGRLRKLEALKLEKHAFIRDKWDDAADFEFCELRFLKIESRDLRVWKFHSYCFLKLESLVITGCTNLKELPYNVCYLKLLKTIEVVKCGPEIYLSAANILKLHHEEQEDRGNSNAGDHPVTLVTDKNMGKILLQHIESDDQGTMTSSCTKLLSYLRKHVPRSTFVVQYVMQFHSYEFNDVITDLDRIALSHWRREYRLEGYSNCWYETEKKRREFSELFVNSFIPKVQKFFTVLKLHHFSDKNKHLSQNEILAAFLNFLLQVLHLEENISSGEEQLYTLLRNQLSFLLAVLGDIPFQLTHPRLQEEVNNLLEEFELLANEAGSFISSCVLPIRPVDADLFYAETINLVVKAELLNADIARHCNMFSEIPMSVVPRPVIDSFFIFDSLIEDIENLENHKINFFDDDEKENQIGMLKDELNISKRIIKVTDQISEGADANAQKEALIQIKDLVYQAEYLINSHVVGNIPSWYLNLRIPHVVQEIKIVNERLRQVKKLHDTSVIKASGGEPSSGTLGNPSTMDDIYFLPFNDDREKNILEDLFKRSLPYRKIISISGMPGLGKTTTATKLYSCLESSEYFDRRAWCVVSQEYSLRSLFVQILRDIAPHDDTEPGKETTELGVSIHKTLYGRRYLIVLDDVWDSGVLDCLIRHLPDDINGSRVIVTSRVKGVAPNDSIFHELALLSNDQCWDLLKKKVFPKEPCPLQLDDIGKKIAEKCGGIPLAVVTTAGILANLDKETSVWERVAEQLDVLLLDGQSNYRKILELSYEHLPRNLKPCFLYFAAFPEDAEISKKLLTWMWISERFIIPKDGKKSPEEIAETYFLDLINRNLVMTEKRGFDGRIRTCRIHDLLHDICVAKANEENFIKLFTNIFSIDEKDQGLSPPSTSGRVSIPFGLHSRSLKGCHTGPLSYFRTMALLKAVELPPKEGYGDKYPRYTLPVQLRYLGIGDLQERTVANLVNLEFIRVRGYYDSVIVVPSVILRMRKLRHLSIRKEAVFKEDCSSNMRETTNLRSLSYVWIKGNKDEDILRHSPHLQKLKCKIGGEVLFPDLGALAKLESLRIDYEINFRGEIVLTESSFPSTIKKLCLSNSKLPWEKMSTIGKLPKLQVLKLEDDAFVGEEWETNDDEFQELRFLKMNWLDLSRWTSETSHFPALEHLVVHYCRKLQEIPSDLGYIQMLQRIDVIFCAKEVDSSAEEIKKEQHENGNPGLQVSVSKWQW